MIETYLTFRDTKKMKTKISILLVLAVVAAPSFGFAQSATIKSVVAGGTDMSTSAGGSSGGTMATDRGKWPNAPKSGGRAGRGGTGGKSTFSEAVSADFFYDPEKQEPVLSKGSYRTAGYLTDDLDTFGEVIDGSVSNQASFSLNEAVYIDKGAKHGVSVGDSFMVVHLSEEVVHPHTRHLWIFARKSLGYKVLYDGVLEVVEVSDSVSKAMIRKSYQGIERGDKVIYLDEAIAPPTIDPDKPVEDKKITGYIVASRINKESNATGDIIYLDVGEGSGVAPGDVFDILDDEPVVRRNGSEVKGLPKIKAKARVVIVKENASTAYIYNSSAATFYGNRAVYTQIR